MLRNLQLSAASVTFRAGADGDASTGPRPVDIVAYTGGLLKLSRWDDPVVIDMATFDVSKQRIPLLYDHYSAPEAVVGHSEAVVNDGKLIRVTGVATGVTEASREVIAHAKAGHPWEASVGGDCDNLERVQSGVQVQVNGQTFTGPLVIARNARLREVSFVILGADRNSSALVARLKGARMSFEQWLLALGFDDPAALTDIQRANLEKLYSSEVGEPTTDPTTPPSTEPPAAPAASANPPTPATPQAGAAPVDLTATIADLRRQVELLNVRANRPAPTPNVNTGAGIMAASDPLVIAAAIAASGNLPNRERHYPERVLEAADRHYKHRLSLHSLLLNAARANGYHGDYNVKANLRSVLQAAFSNFTLPGILSNNANKFLLEGFNAVEAEWRKLAAIRSVSDFKTVTSYRLSGAFQYEKVGADGELKHGTVGESSYTNKADTYGAMFALTRQDLINDDLGALTQVPTRIGRGAALKLNDVFWTTWLDNSTHFTSGRGNYFAGSSSALSTTSLQTAEQKFLDQTDADGKPLGVMPAVLAVPTALKRTAMELLASSVYLAAGGGTNTRYPATNTWQGAYDLACSAYMANSRYTGYSSTAWYLAARPADLAAIEVCFLNGVEVPTVETADVDFNTLGVQMRGYHDFGVALQEYRAAVKSFGAADS